MASAAEQLAANLDVGAFQKATELHKRIWFTLVAMVIYRLGTYIPIPGINAAVSFYGAPPDLATMAKIQAPVLAFAGDQDPGLAPKVAAAAPDMQRLGKTFEFKIYPNVTHAFLEHQNLGENAVATLDSWPRAMAFFKRYLNAQTSTTNTRTN